MTKLEYSILLGFNEKLYRQGVLSQEEKEKMKYQLLLAFNKTDLNVSAKINSNSFILRKKVDSYG